MTAVKPQQGFTLLELVIVIVLVSIMAISLSSVTTNTVSGYIDAKDRNRQSQSAKFVTERIAREAREALPQSVRVNSSGSVSCVEFMDIVNASTYLNLPASGPVTTFNAVDFDLGSLSGSLVAIMPIDANAIYSVAGTLGNVASVVDSGSQVTITLGGPTTFSRRSPQSRFYLLASPVSFCLDDSNGEVRRYENYAISSSQPLPPGGGVNQLLGENFSANGNVFNYQAGTLQRSGLLQMNFRMQNRNRNLTGNSESFEVFHEVHIRNVP